MHLPFLVACAAAALWLPALPGMSPRPSQPWRGYHTVLIRADSLAPEGLAGVVKRLAAVAGPGVITELTAPVDYWDFGGVASVAYASLDARLDPMDPRRDPYLDGLRSYFRLSDAGAQWRVAYAPARQSATVLFLRLSRRLGSPWTGRWRLAGFDPLVKLFSLLGLLGLAAIEALRDRRRAGRAFVPVLLSQILWVPTVLAGSLAELALALILIPAGDWLIREAAEQGSSKGRSVLARPVAVYAAAALVGALLILVFEGLTLSRLLAALCPAAGTLLLVAIAPTAASLVSRRSKRHLVFQPVAIVRSAAPRVRYSRPALAAAILALLLATGAGAIDRLTLPTPQGVFALRGFSWSALQRLDRTRPEGSPPDLSMAVTHAAYQETLEFGRPWRLPKEDERVTVHDYLYNPTTGAMVGRLRTVKVFDSTWLASALWGSPPGSVEQLLVAQGGPVAVRLASGLGGLRGEMPCVVIGLLALLTLLGMDLKVGPLIRENLLRINSAARRNQDP